MPLDYRVGKSLEVIAGEDKTFMLEALLADWAPPDGAHWHSGAQIGSWGALARRGVWAS